MTAPVIAIGIDAMSPELLERWVSEGKLPVLARLFAKGTYARQINTNLYRVENSWLTFLQGCTIDKSREWGHQQYDAGKYQLNENATYRFNTLQPFYALAPGKRVAVFDIPLTRMVPNVDGVQLLGWGTEVNQILRQSQPPGLMRELIDKHGRHPLYDTITNADDGAETLSYRIPSAYDYTRLAEVKAMLLAAIAQRTAILKDVMAREQWDLFMATYAEAHTAGHIFWHLSQPHLLSHTRPPGMQGDWMLEIVQAIDKGLGDLLDAAPKDAQVILFSPHGMVGNAIDLYAMFHLPELLYRWSTGKAAFTGGAAGEPVPAPRADYTRHWREEVWALRTPHGNDTLESPYEQEKRGDPLDWDPGNWYRDQWHKMRAFVLPGYSEGLIRINVAGRDGDGGVPPESFDALCEEITALAKQIVDPRSGERLVQDVIRVRQGPFDDAVQLSAADLMVVWREDVETDVADHPTLGRVGPAPFFRTGGHSSEGFVLMCGPGFEPGARMGKVTTPQVTATVMQMMGAAVPPQVDGVGLVPTP
ncbi:alkaline phosphatase family protein [Caenimonas koreensis]|uniref:alkaline phosphatase family protein n=1 Tax=Caenimonas koreensis TaxID=367474 RepID=UPI003784F418